MHTQEPVRSYLSANHERSQIDPVSVKHASYMTDVTPTDCPNPVRKHYSVKQLYGVFASTTFNARCVYENLCYSTKSIIFFYSKKNLIRLRNEL